MLKIVLYFEKKSLSYGSFLDPVGLQLLGVLHTVPRLLPSILISKHFVYISVLNLGDCLHLLQRSDASTAAD